MRRTRAAEAPRHRLPSLAIGRCLRAPGSELGLSPQLRSRTLRLGLIAALALVLLATTAAPARAAMPEDTCLWIGPLDRDHLDDPDVNVLYPDTGAAYWVARFNLPDGARLLLSGRYPHARYMSLNAYRDGSPADTLTDTAIRPRGASTNPFVEAKRRDRGRSKRRWRVRVLDREPPAREVARKRNTLYAAADGGVQELIYRVYAPDRGRGSKAGGGLPRPTAVLADGSRLRGRVACAEINDPDRQLPSLRVPVPVYEDLVRTPGADFETTPAFSPPRWEAFFNYPYALTVFWVGTLREGERETLDQSQLGGQYSHGDARYVFAPVSRAYGQILVLRGKMPTFPTTERRAKRMPGGDVRYWSLCQNESPVTTSVISCLYDEQVPLAKRRRFTVVVGTRLSRPPDARHRCGVAWLPWGRYVGPLGRRGGGLLLLRNLRPDPSFAEAIQNVERPGEERAVVGPYLPRGEYMASAEFVAPGCR